MIRSNKVISLLVSASFLINTIVSDLAFSQQLNNGSNTDTLAAPLMTDDIVGIEFKDMGRIKFMLQERLKRKYRFIGLPIILASLKRALMDKPLVGWEKTEAPDTQFFYAEMEYIHAAGFCVKVRIDADEDRGYPLRTYYAIFSINTKNDDDFCPVTVYTEAEYKATDGFKRGVPTLKEEDAREIDRYVQHERGVDSVIRYAHEHGLAREPIPSRFNYKNYVRDFLAHVTNIKVSNPDSARLTPIEDRKFYLVKLTEDKKRADGNIEKGTRTMIADNPAIVVDADNNEHRIEYRAHSSNSAVHVFVYEDTFEILTNPDVDLGPNHASIDRTRREVAEVLDYELGVPFAFPLTVDSKGKLWNEMKRRALSHDELGNPYKAPRIKRAIVSLDHIKGRDYASGEITQVVRDWMDLRGKLSNYVSNKMSPGLERRTTWVFLTTKLTEGDFVDGIVTNVIDSGLGLLRRRSDNALYDSGYVSYDRLQFLQFFANGSSALTTRMSLITSADPITANEAVALARKSGLIDDSRTRPGKSPADAWKLIKASPLLQGLLNTQGHITVENYLTAYEETGPSLGFDPPSAKHGSAATTARRDLNKLVQQGRLLRGDRNVPFQYSLPVGASQASRTISISVETRNAFSKNDALAVTSRTRPGKSPADAEQIISDPMMLTLLTGKEYFTLNDYLAAYRELHLSLGFEPLAVNPESTARRDLAALVEEGKLVVDISSKQYKYSLAKGYRLAKIGELGVIGEERPAYSSDYAAGEELPYMNRNVAPAIAAEDISSMISLATEAGLQVFPPVVRYKLLVTSEFFANEELKEHRVRYADRFDLDTISGATSEQIVSNILAKAGNNGANTIALVPNDLPAAQLKELTKAGIRFIRVDTYELRDAKAVNGAARAKFQVDTYAMMLLLRRIDKIDLNSSVYRVLNFYLKSHFAIEDSAIAVDDYIAAVINNDITRLIKGYLSYRPIERYRTPSYHEVAAALVSA